jgi:hypothetical protein
MVKLYRLLLVALTLLSVSSLSSEGQKIEYIKIAGLEKILNNPDKGT